MGNETGETPEGDVSPIQVRHRHTKKHSNHLTPCLQEDRGSPGRIPHKQRQKGELPPSRGASGANINKAFGEIFDMEVIQK